MANFKFKCKNSLSPLGAIGSYLDETECISFTKELDTIYTDTSRLQRNCRKTNDMCSALQIHSYHAYKNLIDSENWPNRNRQFYLVKLYNDYKSIIPFDSFICNAAFKPPEAAFMERLGNQRECVLS